MSILKKLKPKQFVSGAAATVALALTGGATLTNLACGGGGSKTTVSNKIGSYDLPYNRTESEKAFTAALGVPNEAQETNEKNVARIGLLVLGSVRESLIGIKQTVPADKTMIVNIAYNSSNGNYELSSSQLANRADYDDAAYELGFTVKNAKPPLNVKNLVVVRMNDSFEVSAANASVDSSFTANAARVGKVAAENPTIAGAIPSLVQGINKPNSNEYLGSRLGIVQAMARNVLNRGFSDFGTPDADTIVAYSLDPNQIIFTRLVNGVPVAASPSPSPSASASPSPNPSPSPSASASPSPNPSPSPSASASPSPNPSPSPSASASPSPSPSPSQPAPTYAIGTKHDLDNTAPVYQPGSRPGTDDPNAQFAYGSIRIKHAMKQAQEAKQWTLANGNAINFDVMIAQNGKVTVRVSQQDYTNATPGEEKSIFQGSVTVDDFLNQSPTDRAKVGYVNESAGTTTVGKSAYNPEDLQRAARYTNAYYTPAAIAGAGAFLTDDNELKIANAVYKFLTTQFSVDMVPASGEKTYNVDVDGEQVVLAANNAPANINMMLASRHNDRNRSGLIVTEQTAITRRKKPVLAA